MSASRTKVEWRLFGGLSAVLAGLAARRLLATVWTRVTGKTPPTNPASPSTTWPEAVGWAAASGVAMGVARLLATRKAAATWAKRSGRLPPGLEEVS
jgi:hypothetical protein